jgi:hypothetical protein
MTLTTEDLIDTCVLCILEDGLSWADAFRQFRQESGWSLRSSMDVGRLFERTQAQREAYVK